MIIKKFRSFKSRENIHKKEVGLYQYLGIFLKVSSFFRGLKKSVLFSIPYSRDWKIPFYAKKIKIEFLGEKFHFWPKITFFGNFWNFSVEAENFIFSNKMGCFGTKTACEIPNWLNKSTVYQSCKFLKLHYWNTFKKAGTWISAVRNLAAIFCAKTILFDVIMMRKMSSQAFT